MFVLEPESAESLQATLAFLDEALSSPSSFDSEPSGGELSPNWSASPLQNATLDLSSPDAVVQTSHLVPSPLAPTRCKKQRKFNPNKARDDRKRELDYLRSEAEELEFKLSQLQAVKANRAIGLTGQNHLSLMHTSSDPKTSAWAHTCARQLEGRLRAERESIHLRSLLESQLHVAKSMEKLLNKRITLTPAETLGGSKRTTRVHVSREANTAADAAMYAELRAGVDVSYQEVDAVFAASGPPSANGPTRQALMRDGANGKFLDIYDSKVMPFSMLATGEAWWRRWNHFNPNQFGFRIESTDDSIVEHFGMEMRDLKTRTTAKFYVQLRLRRHVEEHRVVVVWQSHFEPLEFFNKKLEGIRFRERGYVVIKPYDVPGASEDEAFTLVQTCYKITPHLIDQRLRSSARARALTEFVLSATVDNIAASTEMIENMLVDSALQQRSRM